jgi:cytochrome c oxidase subunit 1
VLPRGHVPHFVWALYATALLHVLSVPLIGSVILTLGVEHLLEGLIPGGRTGDPYPFQQFIGFYTQVMTYMAVTPALGVLFELVAVHGRIDIFRHRAMVVALILAPVLALSAELLEALHTSDLWRIGLGTLAIVPGGVVARFWLAAIYKGGMQYTSVGWYASFIIVMAGLNAATSWVPRRHVTIDPSLSDTHFAIGVFHYAVAAYCVTALLAGLHHWWPKFTGKLFHDTAAKVGALLVFVGFSVACFFEIVLGYKGMPRRYNMYLDEYQGLHQGATAGAFILAIGVVWSLVYLAGSLRSGRRAPANPWGGQSLEWQADSPPITCNFSKEPEGTDEPYDFRGA